MKNPPVTIAYEDLAAAIDGMNRADETAQRALCAIRNVKEALEGWRDAVKFGRVDLVEGYISAAEDAISKIYGEDY